MSEMVFRFRQFDVQHGRSSMRVGTDAVLLGAWAEGKADGRILDIGTGCGVVALMMAQRFPQATVVGIDVDEASIEEAQANVAASAFAERLTMMQADVRTMAGEAKGEDEAEGTHGARFDSIVCNPPYFTEDTLPPDERRSQARNTSALSFAQLVAAAERLLAPEGTFSVVLPTKEVDAFAALGLMRGLSLQRRCDVQTTPRKQPKRTLLTFSRTICHAPLRETLVLMNADASRSEAYTALTRDFYLW